MNAKIYNLVLNRGAKIVGWENGSVCLRNRSNYKAWYMNGKLHRINGPAIEWGNNKIWHLNGSRHRADGPAVEYADGTKFWYLGGKKYTEEEFSTKI